MPRPKCPSRPPSGKVAGTLRVPRRPRERSVFPSATRTARGACLLLSPRNFGSQVIMRWDQTEYILKGLYLGLLVVVALHEPTWSSIGVLAACTAAGLAIALGWAAVRKLRDGVVI